MTTDALSGAPSSHRNHYLVVWAWLCLALLVSLGLGAMRPAANIVLAIFCVALVKAYLVAFHFMHLKEEPRPYRVLVVGTVAMLVCLFVGVYPDMAKVNGRLDEAPVSAGKAGPAAAQAVVPVAAVVAPVDDTPGDPEAGAKVYGTFCVPCHQVDGKGMGGKVAANFVDDKSRLAKSDAELFASVTNGVKGTVGQMPPWGPVLSAKDRKNAIAYIRKTFGAASP